MNISVQRLHKDLILCNDLKEEFNITISPREDNFLYWDIIIIPQEGMYSEVPLNFIIKFTKKFPFESPTINLPYYIRHFFVTPILDYQEENYREYKRG